MQAPDRSSLEASQDQQIVEGLDGLRAIAVSLVIANHYGLSWVPGGYGVTLFFVLSGFLITRLLVKEQAATGSISFRRFYLRRALRIFPAFYAYCFLVLALLVVTDRTVLWPHAISALAYVSNYYNAILGDPNTAFSHTWSLAIEEQFYLLWPLALVFLLRAPAAVWRRLLFAIGAIWALRFWLTMGIGVNQGYIYAAFETRADALLVGCLAALATASRPVARKLDAVVGHPATLLLAIAGFVGTAVAEANYGSAFRNTIGFAVLPIFIVGILMHVTARPQGLLTWALEYPPLVYVGRISYGMYLYQQIVVYPAHRLTGQLPMWLQVVVVFAIVIGLATGSFFLLERPLLRLKDRFAALPTAPKPGQARAAA